VVLDGVEGGVVAVVALVFPYVDYPPLAIAPLALG